MLDGILFIILLTLAAGMAMPLGGFLASIEHIHPDWLEEEFRHSVIAFGGGVLLAAVALVLVPAGSQGLPPWLVALYFCAGGFTFMVIDIVLYRLGTSASQFVAMLVDFIPEAMALGAAFAMGEESLILLAGLMALQNLPEGFNAYREFYGTARYDSGRLLKVLFILAWVGPLSGVFGALWLAQFPEAVAAIMLFAAGGILYSVFQDIAPQAKLEQHWAPPLGAVCGFALGVVGHLLIQH